MKMLTVTQARQQLGHWLKLAENGEEIAVIQGASVFALRKVPIQAADYMETEYGFAKEEANEAAERIRADARKSGDTLSIDDVGNVARGRKAARRVGAVVHGTLRKNRVGRKAENKGKERPFD